MSLFDIVDGWTGVLGPFTLKADGVAVPLTGFTVVPEVTKGDGTVVTMAGVVTLSDQVATPGQLTYTPASTDFALPAGSPPFTPYYFRWKVTDGAGKIVFFPNSSPDEVDIYRV